MRLFTSILQTTDGKQERPAVVAQPYIIVAVVHVAVVCAVAIVLAGIPPTPAVAYAAEDTV